MSETMITALITAGSTLMGAIIANISTMCIPLYKEKLKTKQNDFQTKRENLTVIYKKLISIINSFPTLSPNDILNHIEYSPNYFFESFDATIKSLDYQIKDYKNQLNIPNINFERKNNIEAQISNREYAKKQISEIRYKYFSAKDKYQSFYESDKAIFDLYAGQAVKNCLIKFEVAIHNVFISGYNAKNDDNPRCNSIEICSVNLINSMRNDIGIY